jgi:quinol-cytochrome oxidoreductase complex cytochrome b subunit
MFMFQTLRYLPAEIMGIEGELVGIGAFGVVGIVLLFVPFLDKPKSPDAKPGKLWTWLTFGALAYILLLSYLGYTFDPNA